MFTFESFRHFVLRAVEGIGDEFDAASDDWESTFLGVDSSGSLRVIYSLSETGLLQDEAGKDELANHVLPAMIRDNRLVMYGLIARSTTYRLNDADLRDYRQTLRVSEPSITEDAEHVTKQDAEKIVVMIATSTRFEQHESDVIRGENSPPRLSCWSFSPSGMSGRFVDSLRLALLEEGRVWHQS